MTLFISYSSADAEVVGAIERHLESFGKKVWRDNELTGGQAWWAAILEQIRECDVFIFAVSPNSLESDPCALEYGYAKALGLPILPVEIGDVPAEARHNHAVYSEQIVDYRTYTPDAAIALMRAVSEREAARKPLPDPLPPEPPIPYEYLLRLSSVIRMRDPIPFDQQRQLIGEFRDALARERNETVRRSISGLLQELKARPETSHSIEAEIDELLAKYAAPAPVPSPAPPMPSPAPPESQPETPSPPSDVPAPPLVPVPAGAAPYPPDAYPTIPQGPGYPGAYTAASTGGFPATPPPPERRDRRRLAIILGAVGAGVVALIVILAIVLWPRGTEPVVAETPTPSVTPTPTTPAQPVVCWDGAEEATAADCSEFTGPDALEWAFLPGEGPEGEEAFCTDEEPTEEQAADGAIARVFCSWDDLPGTSLELVEWDMEPQQVQDYWAEEFDWDSDYTWTLDDEPIGHGWDLATTLDSGDVWLWAGSFDELPFSFEILSSAGRGGSAEAMDTAWNAMNPLSPEEIAALPGTLE